MLEQLLAGAKDGIIKDLMGKLGLNADQAGGFLQKGLALIEGALKSGTLKSSSFVQGGSQGILSKLNIGSLAGLAGGDAGKARTGMESILTPLINSVKNNAGGAEALLGQLTGAGTGHESFGSKVVGIAGKVFGKH